MQTSFEEAIQELIGIKFHNNGLLHQALLHRSYLNENQNETTTNERLEFLGDAILEFIVSKYLFHHFQKEDEGHLTALRSKLVNTIALAKVSQELSLGKALYLSKGEEKSGGRNNTSLLANTTEALIGAIFLDQGIEITEKFVERFILPKISDVVKKSLKDPKSLLQEYVQASGFIAPLYKTVSEVGPDHAKQFTVEVLIDKKPYAKGFGPNKQTAAQQAAENALINWKKSNLQKT